MLPFNKTVIIMPTFNEIENISKMIRTVFKLYPDISMLVIDDGSPDGTGQAVKGLQKEFSNLHLLERRGKLGLGTAYITGFKWAIDQSQRDFEYIMEMDCDFSHDPAAVADLLAAAQVNDLAIGSRYVGGIRIINWPFSRLLISYGGSIYTRMITGMPILDTNGGFKCFKRSTLQSLDLDHIISTGYSFQIELNYRVWSKGFKIKEVPIVFTERREGKSKMSGNIIFEALFKVIYLRIQKMMGKL
ncbi:MAG: polyprenol monophosphomannose synthase [Pseudomonadota bacterium]